MSQRLKTKRRSYCDGKYKRKHNKYQDPKSDGKSERNDELRRKRI